VACIVGFTEQEASGVIYNAAAVFYRGEVVGIYRKLHPAIRRSVYAAGSEVPVFRVQDLTFGIVICNDSNYSEPARLVAAQGATALFVPTNTALPANRRGEEVVVQARKCDIARATENRIWVIRADVAGDLGDLISYGSSEVVSPEGVVVRSLPPMTQDLIIADIAPT
jgi:predicted amidohydrolase